MLKRYKYRAYPTREQQEALAQTFGCARVIWNKYVEHKKLTGKYLSFKEASLQIGKLLKTQPEYEWLKDASSIALQQKLKDAALAAFDKTKGNLSFKKYGEQQSYRIVGHRSFKVNKLNKLMSEVVLPKMPPLRFKTDRELPNPPSSVTVIREPSGKYFVSFVVETPDLAPVEPVQGWDSAIGLDMGLTHFLTGYDTTHNVTQVDNPRFYRKTQTKLARAQQDLARKTKGSNNYAKAKQKVARTHETIRNQRLDHSRNLVNTLTDEYGMISIETLSIKNMVKNHNLAKSITDAGWGIFFSLLKEKTGEKGRILVHQDQYSPTSKTCSNCAVIREEKLTLDIREWGCASCGSWHDRDINAAINILNLALAEYNMRLVHSNKPYRGKHGNLSLACRETLIGTTTVQVLT